MIRRCGGCCGLYRRQEGVEFNIGWTDDQVGKGVRATDMAVEICVPFYHSFLYWLCGRGAVFANSGSQASSRLSLAGAALRRKGTVYDKCGAPSHVSTASARFTPGPFSDSPTMYGAFIASPLSLSTPSITTRRCVGVDTDNSYSRINESLSGTYIPNISSSSLPGAGTSRRIHARLAFKQSTSA
jgi:hypothetical protein